MASTKGVLCKYFMNGACAFGDNCRFSHNRSDESSQVCKYYLAGNCAYGDRCRYEHSKPSWSSRGQPAPPSRYTPPSGVTKPQVGPANGGSSNSTGLTSLPSGASELGMASSGKPNWDDFMTPDEMDEFEQWQMEQSVAAARSSASRQAPGPQGSGEFDDIMDPADIPLCNEYAATGYCSAGDECLYIHGDPCEICGYLCVHPYNPDLTAQHQAACSEALAAAGYPVPRRPAPAAGNHHHQQQQRRHQHQQQQRPAAQQQQPPPPPAAAAAAAATAAAPGNTAAAAAAPAATEEPGSKQEGEPAAAAAPAAVGDAGPGGADAATTGEDQDAAVVSKTVAAAVAAVVQGSLREQQEADADAVADALADAHISS